MAQVIYEISLQALIPMAYELMVRMTLQLHPAKCTFAKNGLCVFNFSNIVDIVIKLLCVDILSHITNNMKPSELKNNS